MLLAAVIGLACAARAASAQPVTLPEAEKLAKQIDLAATKGETYPLANAMDDRELFGRVLKGLNPPPEVRAGYLDGSAGSGKAMAEQIQGIIRGGGSYRLVRIRNYKTGEVRPLFRMMGPQGLNYHELILFRDSAGAVRVGDIYVYVAGNTLSQTMRDSFTSMYGKDGSARPTPQQLQEVANGMRRLGEMRQLVQAGKGEAARNLYTKLPASVKSTKVAEMQYVSISAALGPEQHASAIEQYLKRYPNGAELDLVAIDERTLKKDYAGVLAAVDRVDKRLGGDPFLDLFRGNAHAARGDLAAARKLLRKAVETYPWSSDIHLALIEAELKAKDFNAVADQLTASEREAGIRWSDLATEPLFAEFVKSPQYTKWKAKR